MYRSGDLVRRRNNGNLEFLSRIDHQVKIRGYRIELGEIEAHLAEHPSVRETVVVAREGGLGDKRLVAYYTGDADVGAAALRGHLGSRLPDYMVPAAYVWLEALPLTPNGKLDRRALPAPEGGAYGVRAYEAPQGMIEEQLAMIWAELLQVERVGRHDNFFELGGHSLLAVRLIARLWQEFHLKAGLEELFAAPVLAAFAGKIAALSRTLLPMPIGSSAAFDTILPIRKTGRHAPLFCIHPLFGIGWCYATLLPHLDPDRPVYALQARGLDGFGSLPESINEMAADYLARIRQIQPNGPYHLLGWSFGAQVAHTIATQLQSQKQEIALLGILDGLPPAKREDLGNVAELASLIRRLMKSYESSLPIDFVDHNETERLIAAMEVISRNNTILSCDHQLETYRGDILFGSALQKSDPPTTQNEWQSFITGSLETFVVPSNHFDMLLQGPASVIGRKINDYLTTF